MKKVKIIILEIVMFAIGIVCIAVGSKLLCDSIGDAAVKAYIEESSNSEQDNNSKSDYIFENDDVQVYIV